MPTIQQRSKASLGKVTVRQDVAATNRKRTKSKKEERKESQSQAMMTRIKRVASKRERKDLNHPRRIQKGTSISHPAGVEEEKDPVEGLNQSGQKSIVQSQAMIARIRKEGNKREIKDLITRIRIRIERTSQGHPVTARVAIV